MLRQLLTLLAVFTGLTAAVEPARALETSVASIQLAEGAGTVDAQHMGAVRIESVLHAPRNAEVADADRGHAAPAVKSVRLRIDRARE